MQSEFGDQRSAGFLSEPEQLACPRCYSTNTKFCYYNNYNLSQPRHRCKSCRRYWTRGGTLRNVPVGGGTHRNTNKRFRTTSTPPSSSSVLSSNPVPSDLIQVDTRADTTSFCPSSVGEKSDCDTWEGRRVEIGLDGGDGVGCTDLAISTPAKSLN